MKIILPQHWMWERSVSMSILVALSVLLTVVLGALKIRDYRRLNRQKKPVKTLFPKSRVFLVEKSSTAGGARPCATGPLFQFDTSDTHASLDVAETYRTQDGHSGSDNIPLFLSGYDPSYESQGMPRRDMYAPLPNAPLQAWKQQPRQYESHGEAFLPDGPQMLPYASRQIEPDMYTQFKGSDPSYGYTRVVEFGEDDSDSGASIPSQNIESLELVDALNMGSVVDNSSQLDALHQHSNPFSTVPSVAHNDLRAMPPHADMDGLLMPFEKSLEPLEPTFALETTPMSHLSEGLRATQLAEREPVRKHDYLIDPNHLLYNSSMPLPLSNPSYSVGGYASSQGLNQEPQDHESSSTTTTTTLSNSNNNGMAFRHLNGPHSHHFFGTQPQPVGEGHYLGTSDHDVLPIPAPPNTKRRTSVVATSPAMKKPRGPPRRKTFAFPESVEAGLTPNLGMSHPMANEALAGSISSSLNTNPSDAEVASSVGSSVVSPKSPKETEGSGDDSGARYRCPHCDTTFRIRGYLTRHIKKHADVMMYNCPFFNPEDEHRCHATGGFSRRDTYKTHLKARHFMYPRGTGRKDRYRMPGNCSGCGERFSNNEEWIETHIQTGLCRGQVYGPLGEGNNSNPAHREASVDSSPVPEQDANTNPEKYIFEKGPYQHDFQRQNILMTHVQ